MSKSKTKDFETTLTELEAVVSELDGDVKLEKALDLFEKGMKLSKECQSFLKGAEEKVEILKKNMDGSVTSEVFGEESDDEDEEDDDDDDDEDDPVKLIDTGQKSAPKPESTKKAAKNSSSDSDTGTTQLSLGI